MANAVHDLTGRQCKCGKIFDRKSISRRITYLEDNMIINQLACIPCHNKHIKGAEK